MIEVTNISKRYSMNGVTVTALDGVSLHVARGEFVVVLGPSGSGKTTLLNIVGALDRPTEGSARVSGVELSALSQAERFKFRRETVSFIFQTFNLFPSLTALENVEFALDLSPDTHTSRAPATEILASVGLGERTAHFPHELSGGEQQRVAIARALAPGNPILLADEPTGELDFHTGVQILDLLERQAEEGKTVLVVTHNREISRMADRVIELSSGRIIRDGAPQGGRVHVRELSW